MFPPPEVEYASRQQLIDTVQTFARGQGCAVTINSSIAGKRDYLKWHRGAVNLPNVEKERQRQTSSRRIDCPFLLSRNFSKKRVNRKLNVMNGWRNHEPSLHPSGHSTHRKLNSEQADTVRNMTLAGVKPLGILPSLLMENECALANLSTLYNERTKLRKDKLNGRTPIQALSDDLQASKFYALSQMWWWWSNNLPFFAHKESIRLACPYHHVVLRDCTYKTNKYRLPLLHIVGMTSFKSQLSIGFCFPEEEKHND